MLSHRIDYGHLLSGPFARVARLMHRVSNAHRRPRRPTRPTSTTGWPASALRERRDRRAREHQARHRPRRRATGQDLLRGERHRGHAGYRLGDPHGCSSAARAAASSACRCPESFLVGPGSPRDPRAGDPLMTFRYDQTWRVPPVDPRRLAGRPSFRAGVDAQIVMDAIVRSAASGQTVDIPTIKAAATACRSAESRAVARRPRAREKLGWCRVERVPIDRTCTRFSPSRSSP